MSPKRVTSCRSILRALDANQPDLAVLETAQPIGRNGVAAAVTTYLARE